MSLFNLPKAFGFISDIWQLRPTNFLMYSTFSSNTNVYNFLGQSFNALEVSIFLYLFLALIGALIIFLYQRKNEVKSR